MRKPLPNALDIDLRGGLTDAVTPHAGVALLIEAIRRSGAPAAADRHLPAKRSQRGLGQGAMVETFVLLSALGGDCLDDLDELRRDMGLAALTGYTLPAASTARQWLDRFHEPELFLDRPAQGAFIPLGSAEADLLAHFTFAAAHRRQIRSTNPHERLNKEIRRRTDVVGSFPTQTSL